MATCTVHWQHERQRIDGFGAGAQFFVRDFGAFDTQTQAHILDLLFDPQKGAGLTIIRNRIWDDGSDNHTPENKPNPGTHHPAPGVWEFDDANGEPKDKWQIWLMHEAAKRGCTTFNSCVWSPPWWMKTTSGTKRGGKLKTEYYAAFAEYVARYVKEYKSRYGIDIHSINVQNEPDLDQVDEWKTYYKPDEMHTLLKRHVIPALSDLDVKLMVGEESRWSDRIARPSLEDASTSPHVDLFSSHAYDLGTHRLDLPLSKGKPVWQTEVCAWRGSIEDTDYDPTITDALKWATLLHKHLTEAQVSAWLFWRFQRPEGEGAGYWASGANEMLIKMNPQTQFFEVTKRLWMMGNYSRFVRPGWRRIEVSNAANDLHITAFKDPSSSSFAIVVVNPGAKRDLEIQQDGFWGDRIVPYRTSAENDLAELPPVFTSNNTLNVQLAAQSITTFTGRATY